MTSAGGYYLQNPVAQPKREVAAYLRENGIRVPRVFASFAAAKAAGVPTIARSEDPTQFAGPSGLLDSIVLGEQGEHPDITNEDELRAHVVTACSRDIDIYCNVTGTPRDEFEADVSFSYWELLPGLNRTIVADSAVEKRYHIFTSGILQDGTQVNDYSVVQGEVIKFTSDTRITEDVQMTFTDLILLYEQVRHLKRFERNHCYMMEMQTLPEGAFGYQDNAVLQVHRGVDMRPATFMIQEDQSPIDGQAEALFVRGATPKRGIAVKTTVAYADRQRGLPHHQWTPLDNQEAVLTQHDNRAFLESHVRGRRVHVHQARSFNWQGEANLIAAESHFTKSMLFKPEVSLVTGREQDAVLFEPGELGRMRETARDTGEDQNVWLRIISDGRRAFLQRAQPWEAPELEAGAEVIYAQ